MAKMSELCSTIVNIRAYTAETGVDIHFPYQQLPNPHVAAGLQSTKLHRNPLPRPDQMLSEQVLGKRKLSPSPLPLVSKVEVAKKGVSPKRIRVTETSRVSGGLGKEKAGIGAAAASRSGSGSGEYVKTFRPDLAKRTALPPSYLIHAAEVDSVRNSPNANGKSLAQPRPPELVTSL